jgi:hypothetical protein
VRRDEAQRAVMPPIRIGVSTPNISVIRVFTMAIFSLAG